ncbi:MAG: KilA-N domain-containing protein [Candidatus Phlomobacter fragariae]
MSNLMNIPNKNFPIIASVEIHTDENGRFNLNSLHKASGEGEHKRPSKWLATIQAKELIAELEANLLKNNQSPNSGSAHKVLNTVNGGSSPGTFAHELLAIEYAGWISPKFRLMVNQIFIHYRTGKLALNDPTTLGLPNFLDPAESAIAWAEQHKKVQLLDVQLQQLETEIDSLKNLFQVGMSPVQFCKQLNGVNINQVNLFLQERHFLYDAEKDIYKSHLWRVHAYARDKYLTESSYIVTTDFGQRQCYKIVLLKNGASWLYRQYLKSRLPMKKDWNGEFTHDKYSQVA